MILVQIQKNNNYNEPTQEGTEPLKWELNKNTMF